MKIEKQYDLPFPVDAVYRAWVSSDTVIPPATAMDVLPEVGGHYRLIMQPEDGKSGVTMKNEGRFLRVEEGKGVTCTWEWNGDGEVSEVDVAFSAIDAGTRVTLTHTGLASEDSLANHDAGWDSYIKGLTRFLDERKAAAT